VLGVANTATAAEIKKAYRKLARKHHPDVSRAADATTRMAEVNEANEVLSDPEKRATYDQVGDDSQARGGSRDGSNFRPPPGWGESGGFEFSGDGDAGDHSAFFEQMFGRAGAGGGGFSRRRRGSDQHAVIELDIIDAYLGAQRTISLRTSKSTSTAHDPRGSIADKATDDVQTLEVKIPKGVYAGQHIRLAGRGGAGSGGAAAGDLLLEVRFKPDARWRADGRDIYQLMPLAPWEAALGTSARVQTPGGEADVNVPAGWVHARKLRLKGRGIPGKSADTSGDLYLELFIALPPADNDASRDAYAAIAKAFPNFLPRSTLA